MLEQTHYPKLSQTEQRSIDSLFDKVHSHPLVPPLIQRCQAMNTEPFLVGGAIRNALLGLEEINDLDILVELDEARYLELFEHMMQLQKQFAHILATGHLLLDLTRVDSVSERICAFDITLNASALGLANKDLLLPLPDTLSHFRKRIAHPTSNMMLVSAPTAALRTVRFASELELTLSDSLVETIRQFPQCVLLGGKDIPCLVFMELVRILTLEKVRENFQTLLKMKLLPEVLPEIVPSLSDPRNIMTLLSQVDTVSGSLPSGSREKLHALHSTFLFERTDEFSSMITFKISGIALIRLCCLFDDIAERYLEFSIQKEPALFTEQFLKHSTTSHLASAANRIKYSAVCMRTYASVRKILLSTFELIKRKESKTTLAEELQEQTDPHCFLVYLIAKLELLSSHEKLLTDAKVELKKLNGSN